MGADAILMMLLGLAITWGGAVVCAFLTRAKRKQ
jgi:hypothetical protein